MSHLKRLVTPRSWPIKRKANAFVTRQSPGPHRIKSSLPLNVVLRDLLQLTQRTRETKKVLHDGKIFVDQRAQKDHRFPVGVMDILSIPDLQKNYTVLYDLRGNFIFHEISSEAAGAKLCKIVDKTILRGKKVQLNLYDGKNIIVERDAYHSGDTVVVSLKDMKVTKHIKLENGALVFLTGGRHIGKTGTLVEIKHFKGIEEDRIVVKSGDELIETLKSYAFTIDKQLHT